MVLLRCSTGVRQHIPENSQYSHFHSRHLQRDGVKTEAALWALYSDFGASPRSLFALANRSASYQEWTNMEVRRLSSDSLMRLLLDASAATRTSHYVVTTGPLPQDRSEAYRTFASVYVYEACCKLLIEGGTAQLKRLYDILHGDSATSIVAGMVFEYRVHQFRLKQENITLPYPWSYLDARQKLLQQHHIRQLRGHERGKG